MSWWLTVELLIAAVIVVILKRQIYVGLICSGLFWNMPD